MRGGILVSLKNSEEEVASASQITLTLNAGEWAIPATGTTMNGDTGVIVGTGETEGMLITNCIIDGVTVMDVPSNASGGGIAGRFTNGTITNCIVRNCQIVSNGTAGGICGWRGTMKNCAVSI